MQIDLESIRSQFPALAITDDGVRRIYFDNPAGTQVPQSVADAVADALLHKNANLGGYFASSAAADKVVAGARSAMADFLNAPSHDEIIFGPNMTTLTLHLSRSIGQWLKPGDEIVLSRMDHDANVWPWVLMARDRGIKIKWLPFNKETFEFDLEILDDLLTDRTRLLCVGGASNLTGTINDVAAICAQSTRGRCPDLHRCRAVCAACPNRCAAVRLRLSDLLGLQVLRAALRHLVGTPGRP